MEIQDIDLKGLIESETGEKFNRQGYIKCHFHSEKTPSLSIKFFPNTNKYKFRCWGCAEQGDALDFIMKYRNLDYVAAREYLGLSVDKSAHEEQADKVKGYIEWEISKFREGQQLIGLFPFVNDKGDIVYFKAKFVDKDGKKNLSYYHIENDKVINKRGVEELPYNLYKVIKGIEDGKVVIVCEGEKDANTLNSMLKNDGYVATSVKGCKDISILRGSRLFVCSDTGKAGEQYKWEIHKELFQWVREFRFINLPGLKALGDNKDVTDWIDAGHTKKELLAAIDRSLDFKSEYDLQQDSHGIYQIAYKGKGEDAEKYRKYLTNFRLMEATRIKFADEDQEGVKLILKSATGEKIERIGPSIVFDDIRTFKNFLGTIDLAFKGKIDDLTDLKTWINKYFALEVEEIYNGIQFKIEGDKILFITNEGAIEKDNVDASIKSDGRNDIQVMDKENLTDKELREIKTHIFKFASPDKTISILGTVINNMSVALCKIAKVKLHHLLIIGEAGSGKSTILESVVAPILNYPTKEIKSLGLATNFSLIKDLSDGNYSMIYEEHKPSKWDRYKISKISEVLRNLYDGSTVARGDKSFKSKNFYLGRPIIIAGEESYYNNEKALIDRSCIIYTSKNERTKENTEAMEWIVKNEALLNKLGKELIYTVLDLSVDKYVQLRNKLKDNIKDLKDRPLNTALNIAMGMEILNMLLKKHGIKTITNYMAHIIENIKSEVLDGDSEAHSVVEQMLTLYNDMIDDGRALRPDDVVKCRGNGVFIRTSEMINQIKEHVNKIGADITPLSQKDFKKQAIKSGYLEEMSNKVLKIGDKSVRFDSYNREMLRRLKVYSIVPPEIMGDENLDGNVIPFV